MIFLPLHNYAQLSWSITIPKENTSRVVVTMWQYKKKLILGEYFCKELYTKILRAGALTFFCLNDQIIQIKHL